MNATHEAIYVDEPPPISAVLVDPAMLPKPSVPTVTKVVQINGRVFLIEEDEGGGLWCERCLGPLSKDRYYDVPRSLWPTLDAWLADADDAREFGAACRAEQEIYR